MSLSKTEKLRNVHGLDLMSRHTLSTISKAQQEWVMLGHWKWCRWESPLWTTVRWWRWGQVSKGNEAPKEQIPLSLWINTYMEDGWRFIQTWQGGGYGEYVQDGEWFPESYFWWMWTQRISFITLTPLRMHLFNAYIQKSIPNNFKSSLCC